MKKNCLVVNKNGFGSVYAVSLLLIVVAFSLLLITQAITYHSIQKSDQTYHHTQLFAIYHVKEMLKHGCEESSLEDEEAESLEDSEVILRQFILVEETLMHAGQSIYFQYNEQSVNVQIDAFAFTILCDLDNGEINDVVYS